MFGLIVSADAVGLAMERLMSSSEKCKLTCWDIVRRSGPFIGYSRRSLSLVGLKWNSA